MDRPQSLVFPHGVEVPIEFPPFCLLPNLSITEVDQAFFTLAAVNTSYFPVFRTQYFDQINRSLEQWPQ